jgi:hypothetical protein
MKKVTSSSRLAYSSARRVNPPELWNNADSLCARLHFRLRYGDIIWLKRMILKRITLTRVLVVIKQNLKASEQYPKYEKKKKKKIVYRNAYDLVKQHNAD